MSEPQPLRSRDLEYIENRLLSPCTEALDGIERLRNVGRPDEANRVAAAAAEFTDVCRDVRRGILNGQHAQR